MKFLENKLQKVIANSKQKALLEEKLSVGDFEFVFITLLDENKFKITNRKLLFK